MTVTVESSASRARLDLPATRRARRHSMALRLLGCLVPPAIYTAYFLRIVPVWVSCVVVVALIVLAPSAPALSRRVALNGTLLLGWVPLVWLVPWPVPVHHGGLTVAAAAAGLAACVARRVPDGRRALLPAVAPSDVSLLVATAVGVVTTHRLLLAGTPERALTRLLPGYDHVAHFNMFAMLVRNGTTTDRLAAAPDGSTWSYADYPQGFHALLATLAELAGRSGADTGPALLTTYTTTYAAVVLLGLVVATATVCSVPGLASRPLVTLPAVGLLLTAMAWNPGGWAVFDGFGSFWLAATMGGVGLVLALTADDRPTTTQLAAVLGALLAVALNWMPLVLVVWPALLVVAIVLRHSSWRRRRALTGRLVILAVGGIVVLRTGWTLVTTVESDEIVGAGGAIHPVQPLPALLGIAVVIHLCVIHPRLGTRGTTTLGMAAQRRARLFVAAPLCGLALCGLLVALEAQSAQQGGYYFLKLFTGLVLVLVPLLVVLGAANLASRPARRPVSGRPLGWRVATSLVALGVATQAFGHVALAEAPALNPGEEGVTDEGIPMTWRGMSRGVLGAVETFGGREAFDREYLAMGAGRGYRPVLPASWFHALTGSMSERTSRRREHLLTEAGEPADTAPIARQLVADEPRLQVVVAPELLEEMRAAVGSDAAASLVAWSVPDGTDRPGSVKAK